MILDLARLLLFPALMAFAAASDLFTMTISNRVSLLLAAGFVVLAVAGGMGFHDMLLHVAAGMVVLTVAFICFTMGWVGGGDSQMDVWSMLLAGAVLITAPVLVFYGIVQRHLVVDLSAGGSKA